MSEIPDPIQWHEGMLLMPQHFQQLASRFEGLVDRAVASATPFPWGVLRFVYDRSSLVNGSLRVLHLEAILQDGFYIRAGSDLGVDLELNLKTFVDQAQSAPLTIYVVVPAQSTLSTRGELARYSSYEGDVTVDETTGEDGIPIPRLRPRVALWAGDLPPSRYQNLPLLQVQAQGDAFQQTDYVAPCLAVDPASDLGRACADTLGVMRSKSYLLAEQWRSGDANRDSAERLELQTKVRALCIGLPYAEAALQSGRVHPFSVYLAMCQLAGNVASLTGALVPPQFKLFRQNDLLESFQPVLAFIRAAVAEAGIDAWITLPFRSVEGRFEVGPDRRLDAVIGQEQKLSSPTVVLGLRPAPGVTDEAVWRWGEGCVIGSASLIPTFLSNRVPGAERRRADRVPGLVQQRGTVLFPLLLDSSVATPGEPLALVERFMNEGRPSEAVLYLQRTEKVQGE